MVKLNFQHHYSSLQSTWSFRNHSNMLTGCSRYINIENNYLFFWKFKRTAIIGNRNLNVHSILAEYNSLIGVDSVVQSIIMNQGILWQFADAGHDHVTHIPNSSTGKSQGRTNTWCIRFIQSHNSKQSRWTLTFSHQTRFIWPQGRNDGCTSPPSFFVHLSSLLFLFLSQSLWMCQQGTKSEKGRKWNETACVYTQLRNPLLPYYNYCWQILMTSVANIILKFTPAVLHMCMAE